jgi:hypothetical protein
VLTAMLIPHTLLSPAALRAFLHLLPQMGELDRRFAGRLFSFASHSVA